MTANNLELAKQYQTVSNSLIENQDLLEFCHIHLSHLIARFHVMQHLDLAMFGHTNRSYPFLLSGCLHLSQWTRWSADPGYGYLRVSQARQLCSSSPKNHEIAQLWRDSPGRGMQISQAGMRIMRTDNPCLWFNSTDCPQTVCIQFRQVQKRFQSPNSSLI